MEDIIKSRMVEELIDAYGVPKTFRDDLVQEIYLILLQYDQQKLNEIKEKNQLRFFIARIIRNQWFSDTSPFFKQYRKYYKYKDDNYERPEDTEPKEADDRI